MRCRMLGCVMLGGLAIVAGCGGKVEASNASAGGTSGQGGATASGGAPDVGGAPSNPASTDKVDLLVVVDNSISMADKQQMLATALPRFIHGLVSPPVDPATGKARFPALRDLHIGVISSSLGSHGGSECSPENPNFNPTQDDHAHLMPTVRAGLDGNTDSGYLEWKPDAGHGDEAALVQSFETQVLAAGDGGCGYEAPLEAMYRFLVDPTPPQSIASGEKFQIAMPQGIDSDLLAQRAAFLRPESAVVVVLLSDENDCSMVDGGQNWIAAETNQLSNGSPFYLPRATSVCALNPDDPCCTSCASALTPPGCPEIGLDPACQEAPVYDAAGDPPNLRCWDQKRRFGLSFLYPTDRYVQALTAPSIFDRWDGKGPAPDAKQIPNPLFASGRDPRLVLVTGLIGVPWQDLASPDTLDDPSALSLLGSDMLAQQGRFAWFAGSGLTPPADPLMIESDLPRAGVSPATQQALAPPWAAPLANAANGHERDTEGTDLEYACIFPLAEERDCSSGASDCDCSYVGPGYQDDDPVCQDPASGAYSTVQRFAKAYPGTRELEVLRGLRDNAVTASICAKQSSGDSSSSAYGYNAALDSLMLRLGGLLDPAA